MRDSAKSHSMLVTIVLTIIALFPQFVHSEVTIDWVTIGNPGNAPDPVTGNYFGGVDYTFQIGKFEVSNAQYVDFLNSVAQIGPISPDTLYNTSMSTNANGGILRAGSGTETDPYIYSSKIGLDNKPVNFTNFFSAMRFVNWLENGQLDDPRSTIDGTYTFINGSLETRNPGSTYFLPNRSEWHKAAFYDPASETYFRYATSSDTRPISVAPVNDGQPAPANSVNFFIDDELENGFNDGFAVTGSTDFDNTQNYLTDVGAYVNSASPYGTFDQAGNVWEWTDDLAANRWIRGAGWIPTLPDHSGVDELASTMWSGAGVGSNSHYIGFRVARLVPEPTGVVSFGWVFLLGLGARGVVDL